MHQEMLDLHHLLCNVSIGILWYMEG